MMNKDLNVFEIVKHLLLKNQNKGTWRDQSEYIKNNYSQEDIVDIAKMLWTALKPISQADENSPEGKCADHLRDDLDIIYFALDEDSKELMKKWLIDIDKRNKL